MKRFTYYTTEVMSKAHNITEINGYYDRLSRIYRKVPKTTCKCCGDCCRESASAYFIEFLNVYKELAKWPEAKIKDIILKSAIWSLSALTSEPRHCVFLGENNMCSIYELRPYNCRIWGYQSEFEFELNYETSVKVENKKFRDYYKNTYGIIMSEPSKIRYCNNVVAVNGISLAKIDREELQTNLAKIDGVFFKRDILFHPCYEPIPVHLIIWLISNYNISNKDWMNYRVQIAKEYQSTGKSTTFSEVLNMLSDFKFTLSF